ncbi:MAG: hypothetical protein A4E48_00282 [Methanosaeta sp. PtaU1.Bin060]|nr:MAG: hypothetical protein A4E48_00282 [Methanosaeta sp. PtaU1.Bin060]
MSENATPLELSAEDIIAGIKVERTVVLKSANEHYNGKVVRIRTLRAREFRQIANKVRLEGEADLAGSYSMAMEACKLGIITPGIVARLEDLDHDLVMQIGSAIYAASRVEEAQVEDFSDQTKAS